MQADAIYDMIGFPDFILDNKELDDVYDGVGAHGEGSNTFTQPVVGRCSKRQSFLTYPPPHQYEVSEDSFFQNMLNFYNFSAKVMADQLRKPPNRDQ